MRWNFARANNAYAILCTCERETNKCEFVLIVTTTGDFQRWLHEKRWWRALWWCLKLNVWSRLNSPRPCVFAETVHLSKVLGETELLFCGVGKSSVITEAKGCSCGLCPVVAHIGLTASTTASEAVKRNSVPSQCITLKISNYLLFFSPCAYYASKWNLFT